MGKSDFLFARPSFMGGIARLFDLTGTLNIYNESGTGEKADVRALRQDWKAIGDDLRDAVEKYRKELECHV